MSLYLLCLLLEVTLSHHSLSHFSYTLLRVEHKVPGQENPCWDVNVTFMLFLTFFITLSLSLSLLVLVTLFCNSLCTHSLYFLSSASKNMMLHLTLSAKSFPILCPTSIPPSPVHPSIHHYDISFN